MGLESQLPHKIVNLLFTITDWNNKMTILSGSWLSKAILWMHSVRWRSFSSFFLIHTANCRVISWIIRMWITNTPYRTVLLPSPSFTKPEEKCSSLPIGPPVPEIFFSCYWVASFTEQTPPPGWLIYQANGSNAKRMAPTCAEPSDGWPFGVLGGVARRAECGPVICHASW